MKEITRISLAALPFNIEVGAKKELEQYLKAVEASFEADTDAMREIESRIVELLAERGVSGEKVISTADIEAVQKQLGHPTDFAETAETKEDSTRLQRRFMRDPSGQMIGGVCSGMAAYFSLDIVLVRVAWVVITILTSGVAALGYLLLWIVTPSARTAADRLQMRGEPVNLKALQLESEQLAPVKQNRRIMLDVLRVITGLGAVVLGILALVTSVTTAWVVLNEPKIDLSGWAMLYFALMATSGILLVLFSWLAGYMLIVKKFTKPILSTLAIVAVIGLSSFIVGASLIQINSSQKSYQQAIEREELEPLPVFED